MNGISDKGRCAQNTSDGLKASSAQPESFSSNTDRQRPGHVLLVEDHADTRHAMVRWLEHTGYIVCGVSSAHAALSLITTDYFDVVISDIGLTEIDGYELMRQIRKLVSTPGIALSGRSAPEDITKSHEAGYSHHLVKPIDLKILESALKNLMTRR